MTMKKGEHHSEDSKRKMSEAAKGKCPSIATRKKLRNAKKGNQHAKGHHPSEETKRKRNEALKGNQYAKGQHWSIAARRKQSKIVKRIRASEGLKTGDKAEERRIRSQIEIRLWREAVFARDNWTCQGRDCGKRGVELNAHHKKPFADYPELRTSIENGLTLCKKCHKKKHKIRKKRR